MNAHACQEMNIPVVYLSPHYITQYNILGAEIPDDHPELGNLYGIKQKDEIYLIIN